MTNINCEIIKDLLPLYSDSVCSIETSKVVEEHLENCTSCSEELRKVKEEFKISTSCENEIERAVQKAGKKIKNGKKRAVIKTLAVVLIIGIFLSTYFVFFFRNSNRLLS